MAILLWIIAVLEIAGGVYLGMINQNMPVGIGIGVAAFALTGGLAAAMMKIRVLFAETMLLKEELGLSGGMASVSRALKELSSDTAAIRSELESVRETQEKLQEELRKLNETQKLLDRKIALLSNPEPEQEMLCDDGCSGVISVSQIIKAKKAQSELEAQEKEEKAFCEEKEEDIQLANEDERLDRFFEAVRKADSFAEIALEWENQGLDGDLMYTDIEREILENSENERVGGGKADPAKIAAFTERIKEESGAFAF